jgi:tetratricopeptide (TPR) repeat protein
MLFASPAVCLAASLPPASPAERVLFEGRIDDAVRMLQSQLAANQNDGETHLLLCRAFYAEKDLDNAIHECEIAARLMPRSSNAQDWLGRAYGNKANDAGPLTGLKLAHRVRETFEAAVALDPHNPNAIDDLAEYYVDAPSIVGGGLDKAAALAARVESDSPHSAHRIRGLAAEKAKDYGTAERELRTAIELRNTPDSWIDLAGFFKHRKDTRQAVDALQHALALDKLKDSSTVDAASHLIDLHAEPDLALRTLQQYLAGNNKSDDAPVVRVHLLIAKLLARKGDKAGASAELNKALALAANYAPAKRALQEL